MTEWMYVMIDKGGWIDASLSESPQNIKQKEAE